LLPLQNQLVSAPLVFAVQTKLFRDVVAAKIIIPPYRIVGIEALILPKSILDTNDPNKGNNDYSFVPTNVSVAPMKL
jgi:hypothetical protein